MSSRQQDVRISACRYSYSHSERVSRTPTGETVTVEGSRGSRRRGRL